MVGNAECYETHCIPNRGAGTTTVSFVLEADKVSVSSNVNGENVRKTGTTKVLDLE